MSCSNCGIIKVGVYSGWNNYRKNYNLAKYFNKIKNNSKPKNIIGSHRSPTNLFNSCFFQ
jgi:hypothetical protein